jgi:hypothetical protein
MKKIIAFITLSLMTSTVYAANADDKDDINVESEEAIIVTKGPDGPRDIAGKVTRTKGKVYYHENNSVRSKRIKKGPQNLYVADIVRTKKDSKAFLTLTDDSKLVMDENSIIHFNGVKQISAEQGIVLFDIKKQGDLKGLKITTKTAVIGIKGTQFVIDTNNDSLKLYMKEGLVNVEAVNEGTFEHHLKSEQSYKDYLKDMLTSFSEYKKKQDEEFVEFVKSIDVPENKAISINGNKLEDIEIPDHIQEQFRLLDALTGNDANSATEPDQEITPEAKTGKKDPFDDEIFKK